MRCLAALSVAFCLLPRSTTAIWPFPPKRFRGNSFIEAGLMGLHHDGRIIAFGDFNGDQFLDVLSLGTDMKTVTVHVWNHDNFQFEDSYSFTHLRRIHNAIPGDFNQDGLVDLLVISESSASGQLDMAVYLGLLHGGLDANPISVPPSSLSQPIPIDMNGDMKIDLLGMSPNHDSHHLHLWSNIWNASIPHSPLFELKDAELLRSRCKLSNPHSSAFVDLNGDCLADLFLVCDGNDEDKFFEIWANNKSKGFSLAQTGKLPPGVQAISFADVDRDGTIDMVFSTCSSVSASTGVGIDCYLNIAYNQQLPLCTSRIGAEPGSRSCRQPNDLCTADPKFKFDLTEDHNTNAFSRFSVSKLFPSSPSALLVLDTSSSPPLPIPLKIGDVNLDGFPDMLLIVADEIDRRIPRLLLNVGCKSGIAGCGVDGRGRRGWSADRQKTESLSKVEDARGAAFLDMDEDGTLDLMILRTGKQGKGTVVLIQNNMYYDAFFLKAIVLNSVCSNGWCSPPNTTEKYHPFGLSYPGATYKYTVLDTSGRRSAAGVAQLPQATYQSLLTPYTFFGLGRTNNYIENLFVGSTKHVSNHYINMEGVIPNSKVVIMPPPGIATDGWKRELFLRPGEWIPWVTVTAVVATVVLAAITGILHWNEQREDELERRRASHHINFDAL